MNYIWCARIVTLHDFSLAVLGSQVDDILETKLDKKFHLVTDKGTLDAIGLHPDGPIKRQAIILIFDFVVL